MAAIEIIEAQTAAVVSQAEYLARTVPVSIIADNLAGAEEIDVYFSVDGGSTWVVLQDEDGAIKLTATSPILPIYAPIRLGFLKDATASNCGLYAANGNEL